MAAQTKKNQSAHTLLLPSLCHFCAMQNERRRDCWACGNGHQGRDQDYASLGDGSVGFSVSRLAFIAQPHSREVLMSNLYSHRRLELREGAPKASTRTYYYLDYSHATDVIKWRMYKLQSVIDHKLRNVSVLAPLTSAPLADQASRRR